MDLKAVLIDDEPRGISSMQRLLQINCPAVNVIGSFTDAIEAIDYVKFQNPDLIFLDIQMPGIKGIEILKQAAKGSAMTRPLFVLVTAYEQFAFSAFEHFAFAK